MTFPQGSCGVASSPQGYGWLAYPQGQCGNGLTEGLLGTIALADDSSAEITTELGGGLDNYEISFQCVKPGTDDVYLVMDVSLDGGATWESGASDYSWSWFDLNYGAAAKVSSSSSGDTAIQMGSTVAGLGIGSATTESISGVIRTGNLSNTTLHKIFQWEMTYIASDGDHVFVYGGGIYMGSTSAVNGIRYRFASGVLANGNIKVKGKKKTL